MQASQTRAATGSPRTAGAHNYRWVSVEFLSDSRLVLRRRHIFPEQTTGAAFRASRDSGEQISTQIVIGTIYQPCCRDRWSAVRCVYVFEEKPMLRSRILFMSLAVAAVLGTVPALAQTQGAPAKSASNDTSVSAQATQTMTDVSRWTHKQWSAAKAKWAEEKDAWNGCQNEARTKNLSGRKSWQFLYDCMTKS
jgi:hypothetical protein